jgi:hypothetical protein
MGAAICTRKDPTDPTESSNELSPGGRARAAFAKGVSTYPDSGLARTDMVAAEAEWVIAADEVGDLTLLACVAAFAVHPSLAKGDFGAPGLHTWLRQKRFRAFQPEPEPAADAAPSPAAFEGPADLRASFVGRYGEGAAGSWLDRCAWREEARVLVGATGVAADWLSRNARAWLLEHELTVERPEGRSRGAA